MRKTNFDTTVYTDDQLLEMVKNNVLNGEYEGFVIWDILEEVEERGLEDAKNEMLENLEF